MHRPPFGACMHACMYVCMRLNSLAHACIYKINSHCSFGVYIPFCRLKHERISAAPNFKDYVVAIFEKLACKAVYILRWSNKNGSHSIGTFAPVGMTVCVFHSGTHAHSDTHKHTHAGIPNYLEILSLLFQYINVCFRQSDHSQRTRIRKEMSNIEELNFRYVRNYACT